ncbi:MAG: hypothetical protein O7D96_02525, partial [SAR324 cluster bacterium]|nr:hypothetical protein [SAR324 cluster bacterium]
QESEEGEGVMERDVPWFDAGMFEINTTAAVADPTPDSLRLNLQGVHRFLKGDLDYSVTANRIEGQEDELREDYVRLDYYNDRGDRGLTLGDTYTFFSPLVLSSIAFRGVSAYEGARSNLFGGSTLIGTAPIGSQVDLFRRGVLIDFTTVDSSGLYRFDNIPLDSEESLFEIQIFTPDGRRLIEFQRVTAQEKMLAGGTWSFQGGAGKAVNNPFPHEVQGAEVRYGVIDWLTLGGYYLQLRDFRIDSVETLDEFTTQGAFFLVRPFSFLVLLGERAQDGDDTALGATRWNVLQTFEFGSLSLEQRTYDDEYRPPARRRFFGFSVREQELSTQEIVGRTRVFAINTTLTHRATDFGEQRLLQETEGRFDRRLMANLDVNLTLSVARWQEPELPEEGLDVAGILSTYRLDSLTSVTARLLGSRDLIGNQTDSIQVTYQKTFLVGSPWSYQASYANATNQDDLYTGGLGYLFSNNIRLSGTVDSENRWLVKMDWSAPFRVGGDPGFEALPPKMFPRGGVEGVVFLDTNGDGIHQPGEETLSDVGIFAPGISGMTSDGEGRFRGWGLPTTGTVALELDMLTMDALFLPERQRTRFRVRSGEMARIDIPVVPGGGLIATVVDPEGHATSPAEGLELVLENDLGVRITTALIEWDGTVVMEGIPPGRYTLYGNPDHLALRGIILVPERIAVEFPFGPEPSWLEGFRFVIQRTEPLASQ